MELQQFVQKKAGCGIVEGWLPQRLINKNDPQNDRRVIVDILLFIWHLNC